MKGVTRSDFLEGKGQDRQREGGNARQGREGRIGEGKVKGKGVGGEWKGWKGKGMGGRKDGRGEGRSRV